MWNLILFHQQSFIFSAAILILFSEHIHITHMQATRMLRIYHGATYSNPTLRHLKL